MSLITQFIINQGIPQETVVLLLMLPIMATVIAFSRQVVGIKGLDIYTPLIIAFAFLVIGLKYGLIIFITILLIGTLMRLLVRRIRLLYLPRVAIILTTVILAILLLFLADAYSGQKYLVTTSIFATLIMVALIERFVAVQIERKAKKAIILTIETLLLAIICYWVASWSWLQNQIISIPLWIILGTIIVNILLGKWTSLRLSEYWRFREVIKRTELPGKK